MIGSIPFLLLFILTLRGVEGIATICGSGMLRNLVKISCRCFSC